MAPSLLEQLEGLEPSTPDLEGRCSPSELQLQFFFGAGRAGETLLLQRPAKEAKPQLISLPRLSSRRG